MPLDPDCVRVLALLRNMGLPPVEKLTPAEARSNYRRTRSVLGAPPVEVAELRDLAAPGPDGPIPLRLYRAVGCAAGAAAPALVYYHGGGWVIGDLDTHDGACRSLANAAGCVVVAVDYRLAPEHPFPAAVEDCAAATRWIVEQAAELAIDPARIAVGGDSAGGNLAAVMALLSRDGRLPPVCYQLLIYPATDLLRTQPAYERFTQGLPLTASSTEWFTNHYLPRIEDALDWRASPSRVASLMGVAPAFVLTAGYDPLCDEGQAYAERLAREGVRVSALHVADQMHGYLTMAGQVRASGVSIEIMGAMLRDAFGR
ncbi:MAG: alpha/beta hydrolase [Acetobacteraceae bacterium]|nr:alpha/beta hydrolase [Acetobacteraceae bacterium]